MSDQGELFDAAPFEVPIPAPEPGLSADRRRTMRQSEAIVAGCHPLNGLPLHPFAAPETCQPAAPKRRPFTCGSCRFRETLRWHRKTYPKCLLDLYRANQDGGDVETRTSIANVSHSAGTDVRAWWPACSAYEMGDQSVSSDAMRVAPLG